MANNSKKGNMSIVKDLIDRKSRSKTSGVVTVAIDNNARQPSIISLKYEVEDTTLKLEYKT